MTTPDEQLMAMRSNDIGLDSLISVDVRSWFLKNFHVSIPVLKVMGNDTMANLAEHAAENVPRELLAQMVGPTRAPITDVAPRPAHSASPHIDSPVDSVAATTDSQPSSAATTIERSSSPQSRGDDDETEATVKIDYYAESEPPADFADLVELKDVRRARAQPQVVLLTGASGLLGHHLLNYLLEKTQVRRVICVAVRQLSERLASEQLPQDDRVSYFEGDLRAERLGLSEVDAAAIFGEVDAVIHNGADTSHLKYYPAVRGANVDSTRWLARMCLPRRVPIHYVSSVGVSLFSPGRATLAQESVTGSEGGRSSSPPADGRHGYIASKWTSERFLERAAARYGLRAWIHRPSTILREGVDAHGQAAEMDWVNVLVDYSHRLGAVPACVHARGALDFVRVGTTVSDIVRDVVENKQPHASAGQDRKDEERLGTGGVTYVHHVGDLVLPLDDMKSLAGVGRTPYYEVSMAEWTRRAIAAGLHPAVAALIETMDAPGTFYPRMLKA